ncbi:MAG: DNA-3-methyladenine glycosylase family protein [Nitrosotalea sp.]
MKTHEGVVFLRDDPILEKIIDRVGEFKFKKRNHHFAVLVESIISQQLATSAAEAIFSRFKALYSDFPTSTDILSTRKTKLRSVGLSGMKIDYLKDLSKHIKEGTLEIKKLPKMSDEDVITQLMQVKGIGRWTAEMFLIFSLGRMDVFPVGDLGLRKGVQLAFSLKELPKPKETEKFGDRWRPYRSVATWYLWKSLQKFDKIG